MKWNNENWIAFGRLAVGETPIGRTAFEVATVGRAGGQDTAIGDADVGQNNGKKTAARDTGIAQTPVVDVSKEEQQ